MEMRLTSLYLDEVRRRALRIAAAQDGLKGMGDAIRQAVDFWLVERRKGRKSEKPQDTLS